MAALDPKYEFTFAGGAPTVGALNAAAGAPQLTVAAVHYLYVASGGSLPAAPGAANRFIIPWTDLDIAVLKVHNMNAAIHGTPCAGRITNLRTLHDAFQRAHAGGLAFASLGSVAAALAEFVRVGRMLAMQTPAAWELGAAQFQALPNAPAAAPALPPEAEWFLHLEFSMGATASACPLALVAVRSVLPGWCSHISRGQPAFQDAASELFEMVGESRATWATATPRRQALAIAAHVSQRLQSVELILPGLTRVGSIPNLADAFVRPPPSSPVSPGCPPAPELLMDGLDSLISNETKTAEREYVGGEPPPPPD